VTTDDLIADLHHHALIAIDRHTLSSLLDAAEVLRKDDTCLAAVRQIEARSAAPDGAP